MADYTLIQLHSNQIVVMAFIWDLNLYFSQKSLSNLLFKSTLNIHTHRHTHANIHTHMLAHTHTHTHTHTQRHTIVLW